MKRRSDVLIYKDILGALLSGPVGPTRLARACNVPYDRLAGYLSFLESKLLVRREVQEGRELFYITQDGSQTHQDIEKVWNRFEI